MDDWLLAQKSKRFGENRVLFPSELSSMLESPGLQKAHFFK